MIKKKRPMRAIRVKCLDCFAGSLLEVRLCPAKDCPLYEYRTGHYPKEIPTYDDGKAPNNMSEDHRKEAAERLRLMRERKKQGENR